MFEQIDEEVADEIHQMTVKILTDLKEIWSKTFEMETCKMNLRKLTEHVEIFYKEIYDETKERQSKIIEDINKLKEEAAALKRLLNVDINLSPEKNVPLYTAQVRLDESLCDLRERLNKRKDQIYELLLEQEALCDELGEQPRELLDDPLPTEEDLQDFRLHLEALKSEKMNRLYMISTCRREIKNFMKELELPIQTDEEEFLLNGRTIPLTQATVDSLQTLHTNFVRQMEETRESIENMKVKLNSLWDCLETSPTVRKKFQKYTDYSQTTYDKFYRELQRCEGIKRQNIKIFVEKIRVEILLWWDKTLKSDTERSRFLSYTNDCYTEDLLALHEMELDDLKRFYSDNEKIFELISERRALWDRMIALEGKASDPGRFNNRGCQLLKEEKERKLIASKLPKIEDELKQLLAIYEKDNNRKFTIFGDEVLKIITMEWEEKRAKKEQLMSARKNLNTPNSTVRTPLSLRNVSTLKRCPSSTNMSSMPSTNKRKMPFPPERLQPSSKRNLYSQLNSPSVQVRPVTSATKSSTRKMRVIGSTIARKSNGSSKKRRSKTPKKIPKVLLNEQTMSSDTCYDLFEEYIVNEPTCRSSMLQEVAISKNKKNIKHNGRPIRTPSKLNFFENVNTTSLRKQRTATPMASSTLMSPARNTTVNKLSTKNLPIII